MEIYLVLPHIMFESMEDQGMFAMHGDGLGAHRYQKIKKHLDKMHKPFHKPLNSMWILPVPINY